MSTEQPGDTALIRVYDADQIFIGIYQYVKEEQLFKPVKMFLS
jgi:hypothetical protein